MNTTRKNNINRRLTQRTVNGKTVIRALNIQSNRTASSRAAAAPVRIIRKHKVSTKNSNKRKTRRYRGGSCKENCIDMR